MPKYTYRQEKVKCGKSGCKRCPHGPYWYAYWSEGGKLHKKYIGKKLPQDEEQKKEPFRDPVTQDPRDELFRVGCLDTALAALTLGIDRFASIDVIKQAYRRLSFKEHPDRGGDEHLYKLYTAAYEVFQRVKNFR